MDLEQWFLNFTNTPNSYAVFQAFVEPHFCPIQKESKNGLLKSDDIRRSPERAPSNPKSSIEPSLRTTDLE